MFDDKGGEIYPKSKQMMPLARGRNGKCNAKGCMVTKGRYLVNVGEKCNLMIPWTKVQILSLLIWFKPHKPLFHNSFYIWYQGLFKMSIEMSSKQAK